MAADFHLRPATEADVPVLERLIERSVRGLHSAWYTEAQREAALGTAFGVDRHLIKDGTYFVVETGDAVVACGGWSRRKATYGGDRDRVGQDELIDPAKEPARIRAFFVDPAWVRRGLGTLLLDACEKEIACAGFTHITMVATLAGEPLYAARGYLVEDRFEAPLPGGLTLTVVRMGRTLNRETRSC